jgi:hypothetical protein
MKKMMMALALCLMSAISFADNRQVSTVLPAETPSVILSLDGQRHVVRPTKAAVREIDAQYVECIVFAGKDKASVTIPVSFDNLMNFGRQAAELAQNLHIISEQQKQEIEKEYQRLGIRSTNAQ